jgi:O-antigen/teichoic acid export membrane protein
MTFRDSIRNLSGLKGLTLIGASDIIASGIGSAFWFYIASILASESYGQVSYFISIASIASTVSLLGASDTISVYIPKNVRLESTVYLLTCSIGLVTAIVLFVMFSNAGISAYVFGAVIFGLSTSELLARRDYSSYSKYLLIQKALMIGLALGLYHIVGVNGILIGIGISFFIYVIRIYHGFKESRINFSLLKERRKFMLNSYLVNLLSTLSGTVDKIIILPLVGFEILGNYQLGIQFISVLTILPSIIYKYILPQDSRGIQNRKLKQYTVLMSIGLAISGIIISPIIIPALFPKYDESIRVIQIMSVSVIPTSINLIFASKFYSTERNISILIGTAIYITSLILFIILLGKSFGVNGMATALVIASVIQSIYYYITDKTNNRRSSSAA